MEILFYIILTAVLALVFAVIKYISIIRKSSGTKRMQEISDMIHEGAMTFLNKEYKIMSVFVIIVSLILKSLISNEIAISFILGAVFSALAGNIGMRIATKANAKTAEAVKESLNKGLKTAFSSGTVMGFSVVGLGLLGVAGLYYIFNDPNIIYGFGFGASSIALFARVGGGIYTKGADVGADLVGKIEKGIPEDDPRNPAVIADNVGDNVGDVAGMGADLFESYVDCIIAAMVIGIAVSFTKVGNEYVILPLILASVGILSSIIGTFFVRVKGKNPETALNKGILSSSVIMAILSYFLIKSIVNNINIFYSALIGLILGLVIGFSTEYYTSRDASPARSIALAARTGASTNIIQGLYVGMTSTFVPVMSVCIAILLSYHLAGLYGIAISAVGMLSTLGVTLAADTYGPVADNAAGITQITKMGDKFRKRAEDLDAVGNTTAAIGKGFAIGSAALTALALFASYTQIAKLSIINIINPSVIVGLFMGALLPFLLSALTMKSVRETASKIIVEVRRQFKTKSKPNYNRCINISTDAALEGMLVPSLLALISPILVGYLLGAEALGGLLIGVIATGFLLAILMANAGGAWDNAKKYIEEGHFGGKGSDVHKAAVIGDTVGDPLKDTSGPSLNIFIKLISIVALIFVSFLM